MPRLRWSGEAETWLGVHGWERSRIKSALLGSSAGSVT
jgi:hypothetical protein